MIHWSQGPDDQMYAEPRLAEHLDLDSLQSITDTYEAIFKVRRSAKRWNINKHINKHKYRKQTWGTLMKPNNCEAGCETLVRSRKGTIQKNGKTIQNNA